MPPFFGRDERQHAAYPILQGNSVNDAILHAIFGDGCAAAVVAGEAAKTAPPGSLAVLDNRSWLVSSRNIHTMDTEECEPFCSSGMDVCRGVRAGEREL